MAATGRKSQGIQIPEGIPDSFEAWARTLESAGLNFEPATRRWNFLKREEERDKALRLEEFVLIYRRSRIHPESVRISLDLRRWSRISQNAAKETWGPRTRAELHLAHEAGRPAGAWLVLEFSRPGSRDASLGYTHLFEYRSSQSGFVALKINFSGTPAKLTVSIERIAGLGYLPEKLWEHMPRFLRRSFGLPGSRRMQPVEKAATSPDQFSTTIDAIELTGTTESGAAQRVQLALQSTDNPDSPFQTMTASLTGNGTIVWEYLIAANPEAVTLQGSIHSAITGSTNDKSPKSLSGPMSNLANLLLGDPGTGLDKSFRQDLVTEPSTKLEALRCSVRCRHLLDAGNYAEALDAVSRLIRAIHRDWPAFEASSIGNTILSETLGDCWAAHEVNIDGAPDPFQMARLSWERAGAMRANRLRILRKIALCARDRNEIDAELNALTEIVQLEKRRRELAKTMIRLAQIRIETGMPGTNLTPDQMLMEAARLGGDDEQVSFACFQHLVGNGNFHAAWEFGNKLIGTKMEWRSSKAQAEVATTLGHMAWSEYQDNTLATRLFRAALAMDPTSVHALRGLAGVATRTGDTAAELEALLDLFEINANPTLDTQPNAAIDVFQQAQTALRICELLDGEKTTASIANPRIRDLIDNTFHHYTAGIESPWSWFPHLLLLTTRADYTYLRDSIRQAFERLSLLVTGPANPSTSLESAMALASQLIDPGKVDDGRQIIEAILRLRKPSGTSPLRHMPESEALTQLAWAICADDKKHQPWLDAHGAEMIAMLDPVTAAAILAKLLDREDPGAQEWILAATIQFAGSVRGIDEVNESEDGQAAVTHLVNIVTRGFVSQMRRNNPTGAARILRTAILGNPGLTNLILEDMSLLTQPSNANFAQQTIANVIDDCIVSGFPSLYLNSRIRTLYLKQRTTTRGQDRITPGAGNSSLATIIESAVRDGQALPLDEVEVRAIIEASPVPMKDAVLQCLMHQSIICDDMANACEWFKICLDHAILHAADEQLASRVIHNWLVRLQPGRNMKVLDDPGGKSSKLEDIATELVDILREIDPQQAKAIAEQLSTIGFIHVTDPVTLIASAVIADNPKAAAHLFRRTITNIKGSRAEFATRLFNSIEQLDPRPGTRRMRKSAIVDLLLGWFTSEGQGEPVPVTLATLAASHLEDRQKARKIVEDTRASLSVTGINEDSRLWVPYYMILLEAGSPDEIIGHLESILPPLRNDPSLLADYPFTVESLEVELANRKIPGPPPPTLDLADMTEAPVIELPPPTSSVMLEFEPLTADPVTVDPPVPAIEAPDTALPVTGPLILETDTPQVATAIEPDESATSEPAPLMPMTIEALNGDPVATQPIAPEPVAPEPVAVEPVAPESVAAEPAAPEPQPEEPVATEKSPQPTQTGSSAFDWRAAVRNRKLSAGMTQKILEMPMMNKIEKHLALQTIAVMRGEAALLDRWDWRVWRKSSEYGYSRQGRERFPSGLSPRIMKTPAFKLLLRAAPFLALAFPERFTVAGLAKSMGMTLKQLEQKRERIDWATGFPGHAGFNYHSKLFADRGLQLFSLAGLGPQVFYDATTTSVYIDDAYFVRKPPTHLYHRVMFVLYSLRTQFHPLLQLHAESQILPELKKLKTVIDGGTLSILAARAKMSDSRLAKVMKSADFEEFKLLFQKAGDITSDDIIDAGKAMQQYVWRLLLADSLDLTGIIEAMLDVDLLLPGTVKPGEVLLMSSQVDPLMNFALALKLENPPN